MTSAKVFYFCYFAAMCGINPFLPLHYRDAGLGEQWIGLLTAIPPVGTLFCSPMWGLAADATQRHRLLKTLAMIGAIACMLALAAADRLALLLPAIIAYAFFASPVLALSDHDTMERLGDDQPSYGRVRVWGTWGWLLCSPLMGWLAGWRGISAVLVLAALLYGAALIVSLRGKPTRPPRLGGFFAGLRKLGGQPGWGWFLFISGIAGLTMVSMHNFVLLRMGELGVTRTWMGVAMSISTITEVPVMLGAAALLGRFGTRGVMLGGLGAFAARALTCSLADTPATIIAAQLLHGPSFGLFWIAGVAHARALAPEGWGATAQGLFGGTAIGMGGIIGSLVGGWMYHRLGGAAMFGWLSLVPLAGLILLALLPAERWLPSGQPEPLPAGVVPPEDAA